MLISEKKWIDESASQTFPFKLILPAKESHSSTPHAREKNGLSSMFAFVKSQSNVRQLPEQKKKQEDGYFLNASPINGNVNNKQPQNVDELKVWLKKTGVIEAEDLKRYFEREFNIDLDCGFYGYSSLESLFMECSAGNGNSIKSNKKPSSDKSKLEADCKNLVAEILQEHPEEFNIHSFKLLFYKRYGYELDHLKLGHSTLKSLLQKIMPGVKIRATSIPTFGKIKTDISEEKLLLKETTSCIFENKLGKESHSDDEATALAGRDGYRDPIIDQDSLWNELGPVAKAGHLGSGSESGHDDLGPVYPVPTTGLCTNVVDLGYDSEGNQEIGDQMVLEKPLFSDEDLSDSESENITTEAEGAKKYRSMEDSSLVKILDSWYSNKHAGGKDKKENIDGLVDCSRSKGSSKPSESSAVCAEKMHHVTSCSAKLRPRKSYSFVSESSRDDVEELVDGILGSLRKSADSKMQS